MPVHFGTANLQFGNLLLLPLSHRFSGFFFFFFFFEWKILISMSPPPGFTLVVQFTLLYTTGLGIPGVASANI